MIVLRFKKCITIDNRYNKYDLTDLILILIDTQNNIIYFIKLSMKRHHFFILILNIFFNLLQSFGTLITHRLTLSNIGFMSILVINLPASLTF